MVKVIITAPKGKMGSLILKEASGRPSLEVAGALGRPGADYIGTEICGVKVSEDLEEIIEQCDLVIDFSTVETSMDVLRTCVAHGKGIICGTTGFTDEQEAEFRKAAETIPMMRASNTSYMVNVLSKMLELGAKALSGLCDIDIMDMHDRKKKDAPSGTAKELGAAMAKAAHLSPEKDITYHSMRAGDISSTHTIFFTGFGERIEVTHRAYNWECFANGACEAARFMENKEPGVYTMGDVIAEEMAL